MTEAIRIAVLNFVHETVTFLPNDTALDDFVHDGAALPERRHLQVLSVRRRQLSLTDNAPFQQRSRPC
jgi:microcystin degradation protein MlrC